jgi:hypothetical protein
MSRFAAMLLAGLPLAAGCLVYDSGPANRPPVNYAPTITYADGGCYWDPGYRDYVWWFESDVDDPDGYLDVTEVYADVYDDATGKWEDGFELYPDTGMTWYSAWLGSSTYLDCAYPYYSVDITAYDSYGDYDVVTFVPTQEW